MSGSYLRACPLADLGEGDAIVVLDVPLLVESTRGYPVAALLVVDVDPELAVQRLVEHRGMREADVRARMTRQATREQRLERADLVIHNQGDRDALTEQVDAAWAWMKGLD